MRAPRRKFTQALGRLPQRLASSAPIGIQREILSRVISFEQSRRLERR